MEKRVVNEGFVEIGSGIPGIPAGRYPALTVQQVIDLLNALPAEDKQKRATSSASGYGTDLYGIRVDANSVEIWGC